jgi:D-amino-acid dehydrogenase
MSSDRRNRTDILIIGGGVIGVCAAYYLVARGREVTVIDQAEIGSGSSYGNAGLIVPSDLIPLAAPGVLVQGLRWMLDVESPFYVKPRLDRQLLSWLWQFRSYCNKAAVGRAIPVMRALGQTSAQLYEELVSEERLPCQYQQAGMLTLFRTAHGFQEGTAGAELSREHGISLTVLDGDGVRQLEPSVSANVTGGIYYPQDAHLNPALFVRALAGRVQEKGGIVQAHTELLGFEIKGDQITAVQTTRGNYHPEQVVLAAGSWSSDLVRDLRLKLPIQPAKGYSITVDQFVESPRIPLILSEARVAVTPLEPLLRFAGTLELAGLDLSINRRRVKAILRSASEYLTCDPQTLPPVEIWRGLRPTTPDGLPIIGRSPSPANLIVAAGHATLGISLGPVTGKLVAQLATGEPPTMDMRPLRLERFW